MDPLTNALATIIEFMAGRWSPVAIAEYKAVLDRHQAGEQIPLVVRTGVMNDYRHVRRNYAG